MSRGRWTPSLNWRAAALLGLITSTFSTLVSTLAATRIGRDAVVDWMVVANIPLRDPALQIHPSPGVILAGILFHQWADFSWAIVFFGLLGRWTAGLRPQVILLVALPWSVFTSASEWLFLVPVLPFAQPVFTLQQVYWIGFTVHAVSASLYPLFPGLRDRLASRAPSPHARFAMAWSGAAVAGLTILAVVSAFGELGREPPWTGSDPAFDQAFMRRMAAHHSQGVEVARLGAERARDPHLRALARLMAASQESETRVFGHWWRSWFHGALPPSTHADHMTMPGMLSPAQIASLRTAPPDEFDPLFVSLMSFHHRGAIAMADQALDDASDLRLKAMAHSIRHEQSGEIALMHGAGPDLGSVRVAVNAMLGGPPPDGR